MTLNDETRPMAATPPSEPPPAPPPGGDSAPRRRHLALIGASVLGGIALLVVAFFVGQSSGSTTQNGPTSLGAALAAARSGALPCGTSTTVTRRALDRLCNGTAGASTGGGGGTGAATSSGGGARALMVGTIQSVSGNQVNVQTGQGPVTLTLGSGAAVRTLAAGAASDLTQGARVLLTGGQQANGVRQIVVIGAGRAGNAAAGGAGNTAPPTS
jgi:hypothetical protein